jgi:phosphatidate cytidylyltransferase
MRSFLSKYSNFTQRVVTGLTGAVILMAALSWSEWGYFICFLLVVVISQLEFYKLVGLDGMSPLKFWGTFTGLSVFVLSFLIERGSVNTNFYYLIFPIACGTFFIKLYKKSDKKPFTNIAFTLIGVIYIALPIALLNISTFVMGQYSHEIIIGLILIFWASDIGAYFAGIKFGKRKLFERISPKKSWEGALGGAAFALLVAYLISLYFTDLTFINWMILGAIIIVGGTYGDLIESLFKRSIEIKDSGTKLPGHGGFLDRFDSLLIASPFLVAYLKLFL